MKVTKAKKTAEKQAVFSRTKVLYKAMLILYNFVDKVLI